MTRRVPTKQSSLTALRERGLPVGSILDVGVQFGTPELLAAYPDVEHLLFEPVEEYRDAIRRTYAATKHRLVEAAVSDADGDARLKVRPAADGSMANGGVVSEAGTRTVPKLRLDSYLAAHPASEPYLLKIDVDGHELAVLRGAVEALKHCSCVVIEAAVNELMPRASFLDAAGFRIWDIVDICYYEPMLSQVDLVFLNRNLLNNAALFPWHHEPFDPSRWHG